MAASNPAAPSTCTAAHGRAGRALAVALCAALLSAGGARAGVVRGVVRVGAVAAAHGLAPDPYAGHASALAVGRAPVRDLVTDAIVYVARLDAAADSALAHDPSGH